MKLRCERDAFLEALTTASRAVTARGGLSLHFTGVRIDVSAGVAHLASTDLELTIQTRVKVDDTGDGVIVVPGRLVVDIVRAFPEGTVSVEGGEDEAVFACGRSQFTVKVFPAGDFPPLPKPGGDGVVMGARELGDALSQVVRAASSDESKPLLTGVLLTSEKGGMRVVATDSYRLAVRDISGTDVIPEGTGVLVPARALAELQRILSSSSEGATVSVTIGENDVTFETGETVLTARLLSGDFPKYQNLIPQSYPNQLTIGKSVLLDAMRRMKLLIKDNTTPVRMSLREEGAVLSVIMADVGQAREDVDATYTGTEMNVAFNPNYLIDGVEAIPTDEVILETIDSTKPATIRPMHGEDYQYLLMPVRVS